MKSKILIAAGALAVAGSAFAHDVIHAGHGSAHTADDGHLAINHDGHIDHLHDGHLHHMDNGHVDEHVIAISAANPVDERLVKRVSHKNHQHDQGDEKHPYIQHGDHFDYLHGDRLHHVHGDHVDDHGKIQIVK
ncbi:MAG: hypothetical protein AAFY83_11980 [Pseudomonadota bacterium]